MQMHPCKPTCKQADFLQVLTSDDFEFEPHGDLCRQWCFSPPSSHYNSAELRLSPSSDAAQAAVLLDQLQVLFSLIPKDERSKKRKRDGVEELTWEKTCAEKLRGCSNLPAAIARLQECIDWTRTQVELQAGPLAQKRLSAAEKKNLSIQAVHAEQRRTNALFDRCGFAALVTEVARLFRTSAECSDGAVVLLQEATESWVVSLLKGAMVHALNSRHLVVHSKDIQNTRWVRCEPGWETPKKTP